MNKLEIEAINAYCRTISDLCNEINYCHSTEKQITYIAFFDISCIGWTIYLRKITLSENDQRRFDDVFNMTISDIESEHHCPAILENFETAIAKLKETLNEVNQSDRTN